MSTNKIVIVSENVRSKALKRLADKLSEKVGYRVYRVVPSRVRGRNAVIFSSGLDKREQFSRFRGNAVACPDYATTVDGLGNIGSRRIVARTLTNAHEGRGIIIFDKDDHPPPAPLYTEYIPKKKEFRVHIWNNEVIDVAEKRKRTGFTGERDTQVRNTANGYVFCRSDIVEPSDLRTVACAAVSSLGRTYGAVDVIWNKTRDKCYVLEVNARPGIEGTTVEKYANAIMKGLSNGS